MTPESFLNEFGAVANAPGGVQKLREMILQLAMQGRLVKQGDVLLVSLITIGNWANGSGFPKRVQGHADKQYLFCKVSDMNLPGNEKFIMSTINTIDDIIVKDIRAKIHQKGTVIFPKIGGAIATNKRRILIKPTAIDNNCIGMMPKEGVSTEWLYLVLQSIDMGKYQTGTSVPALSQKKLESIKCAKPSPEEQKRIVAKVDQLMVLCDQLEAQQQKRSKLMKHTRISALEALANAQRGEELQIAWKRVEENLPTLFESPEDVEDLKKCILQNAVMGKLVPQNPDDEPASELLKKIAKEKAELIKKGEIKRQNPLPEIRDDEKPFEAPAGWELVKVGEVTKLITDGTHKTPKYAHSGIRFVSAKDIKSGKLLFDQCKYITVEEHQELIRRCKPEVGDILISKSGSIGTVVLNSEEGEFSLFESLALIKYNQSLICSEYLEFALQNICLNLQSHHIRGVAVKHLHLNVLRELIIPLSPFEEQKRIVEKTQFLLSLCDTLQKQLAKSRKVAEQLAQSVVESITGISTEKMANGRIEESEKAGITIAEDQADQE